jgi:hypothetical protein
MRVNTKGQTISIVQSSYLVFIGLSHVIHPLQAKVANRINNQVIALRQHDMRAPEDWPQWRRSCDIHVEIREEPPRPVLSTRH